MPRKSLYKTDQFPYHVYNRSNNKEFFYVDRDHLWEIFIECFYQLKIQFFCDIHFFVLMSNHYHLVISTPRCNLGEAMKYLHREVARRANRSSGRINHFFGGRYKWSVIQNEIYYWNCVKYVLQNPVKAELCKSVFDYNYSSLNVPALLFQWQPSDLFNFESTPLMLDRDWLDEPLDSEKEEVIRKGLRRRIFQIPRSMSGRALTLDDSQCKKGTVTWDGAREET
ncbi:MAG: transposase [Bdellovibrionales bacterium]|nr:transposase [Bdellovibrionales bacterium]